MVFEKSDFRKRGTLKIEGEIKQNKKKEIICDFAEITRLIIEWTRTSGWPFEVFSDYLEMLGMKTPVTLYDYNSWDQTFKCRTSDEIEIEITLMVGDSCDWDSEIVLTIGEEKRIYSILGINYPPNEVLPSLLFEKRIIEKTDIKLVSSYTGYGCSWILQVGDLSLQIDIDEPEDSFAYGEGIDESKNIVTRKSEDIENYLMSLNLTKQINTQELYEDIIGIIGFSNRNIKRSGRIILSVTWKNSKGDIVVLNKIVQKYGKIEEITISHNGYAIYSLRVDGAWSFYSDSEKIFTINFDPKSKKYEVYYRTCEEKLFSLSNSRVLTVIKRRVEKLRNTYLGS